MGFRVCSAVRSEAQGDSAANTPAKKAEHDSTMAVIRKKIDEMVANTEKHRRDSLSKQQTDTVAH